MIWLLLWFGCGTKIDETDQLDLQVDCEGMSFVPSDANMMRTARWAYDAPTDQLVQRCVLATSKVLTSPGDVPFVGGTDVFQIFDEGSNAATLQITANGQTWVVSTGSLSLTEYDYSKASGSFSGEAWGFDLATGAGTEERANVSGLLSWCGIGDRADCPDVFAESLPDAYSLDLPFFENTTGIGKTSACRMLVDPTTGALQVDLQAATWNGQNVGQLWVNECGEGGIIPPLPNHLVFRAGGVSGPGTYGPQVSQWFGDVQLPELVYTHPTVFWPGLNATQACSMYGLPATAELQPGGSCTFVVDADAGRFVLDCDNVQHSSPPSVLTINALGDLHLEADCLYLEQPS